MSEESPEHDRHPEPSRRDAVVSGDSRIPGFFEILLDTIPSPVFYKDVDGRYLGANRAFAEFVGLTLDELVGKTIFELAPEGLEDLAGLAAVKDKELFENPGIQVYEATVTSPDGGVRDVIVRKSTFNDAGGRTAGLVGVIHDTTERRAAVEELRASEARFRFMTESMHDVSFTVDLAFNTTYVSDSVEDVLGFTPAERMSQTIQEQMPGASLEFIMKELAEELAHDSEREPGRKRTVDVDFFHKDGSIVTLETTISFVRDRNGTPIGIYGLSRNVTEERRLQEVLEASQEALKAEQEFSETLIESLKDIVYVLSVEERGRLVRWNRAARELSGYSDEELARMTVFDFIMPAERDAQLAFLQALTEKGSAEMEVDLIVRDGSVIPFEVRSSLIRDADGAPLFVTGVGRDIAERRRAEDNLRRVNAELYGFAHTVSHDLKGPLSTIVLAAESLAADSRPGSVAADMAEVITRNALKAGALINELLTLAEAGQMPPEIEDVDISSVVELIREEKAGDLFSAGASLLVDEDLGTIRASETHLYQLFSNLVGNALRHNEGREDLRIEIGRLPGTGDGRIRFLVRDNGFGIPEDDLARVFQPFYKGKQTGATGLGLSIVQRIVNLYEGEVVAYNRDGACFEFSLKGVAPDSESEPGDPT